MNKSIKTMLTFGVLAVVIFSAVAISYQFDTVHNPFTRELDYYLQNTSWTHQSYPAACSSGYVVTALGDTVTCTQQTINGDTNKAIASINMTTFNITMETGIIYHNGTGIIIS